MVSYRYDGYSFKDYATFGENTSNVTNAEVQAICDDSEGNIWIGHVQGLDKLDPATDEVKHFILNPRVPVTDWSNHVLALLEDSKEILWIGTGNGLYLFDKSTETFKGMLHDSTDSKSLIHNSVNAIYEDRNGTSGLVLAEVLINLIKPKINSFITGMIIMHLQIGNGLLIGFVLFLKIRME